MSTYLNINAIQDNSIPPRKIIGGGGGTSDYNDLTNKPSINSVALSGNKSLSDLGINIPTTLSQLGDDATHRLVTDTEKGTWDAKQGAITDLDTIRSNASAGKTASDNLSGHTVAKNVPADAKFTDTVYDDTAIKGRVSAIENKESGWDAKYVKPSAGIPLTDLASGVQTSLGKADSALQAETDPVFTASPAHDITSANIATWNGKQDALVSGQNIKTLNNQSLLGSTNIEIEPAMVIGDITLSSGVFTMEDYDKTHYTRVNTNWFANIRFQEGLRRGGSTTYPQYVLLLNDSPSDIVITLPSSIIAPDDTITIPSGKYIELSYVFVGYNTILTVSQELTMTE